MNSIIKLTATAALLTGLSMNAMADNRTPAQLAEAITPDYRISDMKNISGSGFVWIHHIEGQDSEGQKQVLFNDREGAHEQTG